MNTQEVAEKVVELVRKQAWHQALDTLYDKDIVSVEAHASENAALMRCGVKRIGGSMPWRFIASKRKDRSSRMTGS